MSTLLINAALLITWLLVYRFITRFIDISKYDPHLKSALISALTYSSSHLNDKNYISWLHTQEGASSDIKNRYDRYDENYQRYLNQSERTDYDQR